MSFLTAMLIKQKLASIHIWKQNVQYHIKYPKYIYMMQKKICFLACGIREPVSKNLLNFSCSCQIYQVFFMDPSQVTLSFKVISIEFIHLLGKHLLSEKCTLLGPVGGRKCTWDGLYSQEVYTTATQHSAQNLLKVKWFLHWYLNLERQVNYE